MTKGWTLPLGGSFLVGVYFELTLTLSEQYDSVFQRVRALVATDGDIFEVWATSKAIELLTCESFSLGNEVEDEDDGVDVANTSATTAGLKPRWNDFGDSNIQVEEEDVAEFAGVDVQGVKPEHVRRFYRHHGLRDPLEEYDGEESDG
jgi:hypothetical protein